MDATRLPARNLYFFAVGAVAVAALVRWLLGPLLADHLPYLTFFIAVAVTAWYGGLRPALLAIALGFVVSLAFFVPTNADPSLRQIVTAQWADWVRYFILTAAFAIFGEAKKAALNRAELRRETLQVTLLSIGDGVVVTDTEGRVTSLNPIAEMLTGWKQRDAVGLPLDDVFHIVNEETRKAVENPVAKVLEHGRTVALANHTLLIAKDGVERPIDDSAAPVRAADGSLLGVVLIFRDVTEMRIGERALRASEARKSAVLRTALDSIVTIDHEGRIVDFNPAAEVMFGYLRDEVIGREMGAVIVPPALRERHRHGMQRYLATGEQRVLNRQIELTAMRSDGSEFPVELAITAIGDAQQPMFTGYLRDISNRKQADDALRAAHGELEQRVQQRTAELVEASGFSQALLESLQTGIVACNAQGVLTLFNQATREFHGLPQEPLAADQWAQHYNLYRADGVTALTKDEIPLFRALSGEHVRDVEMIIAPRRGKVRTVCASGQSFYDGAGKHLGAVVSMHDITEGKQAAAALRDAHHDLERRVAARTAELDAANSALQQADRRKDEFLATLAHELRNPLAPIRTAAHLLGRPDLSQERVAWCGDLIGRHSQTMALLLDDLLEVSRITSGRLELKKTYVSVESVIASAVETARPLIDRKHHILVVSVPADCPLLEADPLRASQVLTNLLTNAAKYTDPHGHIELRVQLEGGEVQFDVTDNGVGLSADQLPTMFEMFRQVQGTMDRAEGGLGIGLALSKGLVELHGGQIDAFSAGPGLGARFRVTLPIGRSTSGHCVGEHSNARGAPEGDAVLTVLVADDNVDAAAALAMQLEIEGCRVELAHDGVHAFDLAMRARPQMALLDIGMPRMDGYRLATKLRSQAWGGEMFLVAITGWGQEEDRRKATAAGFDEHLTKPVSPEAILELISRRRQSAAAR